MLIVENLEVRYGAVRALKGVSFEIGADEIVCLIGANGAGKSTVLRALSGLAAPAGGRIVFDGEDITGWRPHRIVALGLSQVPEGRRIFANLTVGENLYLGAYLCRDKSRISKDLEHVFGFFPRLREREGQRAGTLSGGEQQMLAIARAMMARPKLLLMDEPSLGLAPMLVRQIFEIIVRIRGEGVPVLLVEQNAHLALEVADRGYVLETGGVRMSGAAAALAANEEVRAAYLGG